MTKVSPQRKQRRCVFIAVSRWPVIQNCEVHNWETVVPLRTVVQLLRKESKVGFIKDEDRSGITSSDVISSSRSTVLSLPMWNILPPDGYGPKTSNGSNNLLCLSDNNDRPFGVRITSFWIEVRNMRFSSTSFSGVKRGNFAQKGNGNTSGFLE